MALTDSNGGAVMTMPVQPAYGYNMGGGFGSGFGGFGGDGWWIILLLICLGGWGNGFGNNGTNDLAYLAMANGVNGNLPGYTQSNDFSNLERENDIIRQDVCQNFAAVNQTLANGFQGIQTSFAQAELSRSNTQAALMAQMYDQSMAQQNCCCQTQAQIANGVSGITSSLDRGFADTNYNLATQSCDTRNTIQNAIRDAVDAQREGTNAILSALNAQRTEQKDDRIAELNAQLAQAENRALMNGFAASQAAQTEGIKDYVANQFTQYNPRPVPAFPVAAPYQYGNCGCGNI